MTDPYPANAAERRRIRTHKGNAGATSGQIKALALVMSTKCSGEFDGIPCHAGTLNGCANDGSTCLCECHDPHQPPEEPTHA